MSMKTYDIEIQRIKAMVFDKGLIELRMDALVLNKPVRGDAPDSTCLRLSEEQARTLALLLKQQISALDGKKARSQR